MSGMDKTDETEARAKSETENAREEIAAAQDELSVHKIKSRYTGKKGSLTSMLKLLKDLPPEQKRSAGAVLNKSKKDIEDLVHNKISELRSAGAEKSLSEDKIDVTLPGRGNTAGSLHPITLVMKSISQIFERMGFSVMDGPEVELDYYNFEALNIPKDHPARDMQDTFYISDQMVLRTHTSPVQIRTMEKQKPPLRVIVPGKVYRCDSDVSHSPMFHQVEGLMVDRDISFANLKSVIIHFINMYFEASTNIRFRPSFFPFTEPSAEVDIECAICAGKGCRVCKQSGWVEVLGCGMVDPAVFSNVGYDSDEYSGFAFGMGIERMAMLKFGINDIRLFFENDIRFLRQFS